ncbi:hypothetical protein Pla22_21050 [Rubripirellula amarantea]|uniref:DUF1583 domain-containing protein n=1 Tax=Rubripirellula amarantea TaxID=2527999 RepID=A0A5C5WV22_9BACT|nr:DUF1583 domain-containing protein [Rubripirellula amarantea]TWT54458.1 hypothetical protein Pla22_21050 [Rubripirellula amarantea]
MRGWSTVSAGLGLVDSMLPEGEGKNQYFKQARKSQQKQLRSGPLESLWCAYEGEIVFQRVATNPGVSSETSIQYLRPLFDGDSVTLTFWWESGETELFPIVGRTALQLTPQGTQPRWMPLKDELTASLWKEEVFAATEPIATENVPIETAWNTIAMKRSGNTIAVTLNGELLLELPADNMTRYGLLCPEGRNLKVKAAVLTGDWPEIPPTDLTIPIHASPKSP